MVQTALQPADQIRKNIFDRFYWDSRVDDYANIDVEIDSNGEVTLRGSVPGPASRHAAEQDAQLVPGVRMVHNQLRIKYNDNMKIPNDREVESNIRSILKWNSAIDDSKLQVTVNSGYTTLQGTVCSYYQKSRAQELAADVIGVMKIDNRIAVVPSSAHSDEEIANNLIEALKNIMGADADSLTVMVKEGIATLSGTVPDTISYYAVANISRHIRGIIDVHSLLSVSDGKR